MILTKSQYRFGRGVPSTLWGSSSWTFLHSVAAQTTCSEEEELQLYLLLGQNLPCSSCTQSFATFQESHPYVRTSTNVSTRQLAHLLHDTHNHVNTKNRKKLMDFEKNMRYYSRLSPSVWLLAFFDYLTHLAVYQIDTTTTKSEVKIHPSSPPSPTTSGTETLSEASLTYHNLLPIHKLLVFCLKSSLLASIQREQKLVQNFIGLASTGATNLLDPTLYDLATLSDQYWKKEDKRLRKYMSSKSPFLAKGFLQRLDEIKTILFPDTRSHSLVARGKMLVKLRHRKEGA